MVSFDLLNWMSNTINYFIFAFISINLIGTNCFNQTQILITAFGLFISILLHLVYVLIQRL